MIEWLLRFFLRWVPVRTTTMVLMLVLVIYSLVSGVGSTVRGAQMSLFFPVSLLAALLGWWLGHSRLNGWQAAASLLTVGGTLLWGGTARLGGPLLQMAQALPSLLLQTWFNLRNDTPIDSTVFDAGRDALLIQSLTLWGRLEAWWVGISGGANANDPLIRALVWSAALWVLAAWAGWALRRREAIAALAPVLVVQAVITDYTGSGVIWLWGMLTLVIALMGFSCYNANLLSWIRRKLDYSEIISTNTLVAVIATTSVVAGLAFFVPQVSLKDLADAWRKPSRESTAAQSLGLDMAKVETRFIPYGAPGLPQQHLLGSGPELSRDLVFTVRTGELPPIPNASLETLATRYYWRSRVYDVYNGSGWRSSQTETAHYNADEILYASLPSGYRRVTQQVTLAFEKDDTLYWTGTLYRSDQPFDVAWRTPPRSDAAAAAFPFGSADLLGALHKAPAYRVESFVPEISVAILRQAGSDYPDFVTQRYLALPLDLPERVYALARNLTATASSPYDQAKALETYLRHTYPYTLDVSTPPAGVDVADYFLFDLKKGYCDYYATAMAVMARSVGLPARLVTGYASGTYVTEAAEYRVTAANAHSWVEIYFPGVGWVEFEPTAAIPEIVRPDESDGQPPAPLPPPSAWALLRANFRGLSLVTRWVLVFVAGLLGLALFLQALEGLILLQVSPALALRWMYRDLYRLGGQPGPGTTASEYAAALLPYLPPGISLNSLTETYLGALFSRQKPTRSQVWQAYKAWRSLRWPLWRAGRKQKRENN